MGGAGQLNMMKNTRRDGKSLDFSISKYRPLTVLGLGKTQIWLIFLPYLKIGKKPKKSTFIFNCGRFLSPKLR